MSARASDRARKDNALMGGLLGAFVLTGTISMGVLVANGNESQSQALAAHEAEAAAEAEAERKAKSDDSDLDGGSAPVPDDETSAPEDGTEGPDQNPDEADEGDDQSEGSSDQEEAPVPQDTVWQVVEGDTLSAISSATGVSVDKIVAHNGIQDPNVIYAGSALRIPAV